MASPTGSAEPRKRRRLRERTQCDASAAGSSSARQRHASVAAACCGSLSARFSPTAALTVTLPASAAFSKSLVLVMVTKSRRKPEVSSRFSDSDIFSQTAIGWLAAVDSEIGMHFCRTSRPRFAGSSEKILVN